MAIPSWILAQSYTLGGTIYGGGNPLENATVRLLDAASDSELATDTSDAQGQYDFIVTNGTYDLLVEPPAGSGFPEGSVDNIVIDGANVTQNVVLFAQSFEVSGTVTLADGTTPVPNVDVSMHEDNGSYTASAWTDENGEYTVYLPAGTYRAHLWRSGYQDLALPDWFEFDSSNFTISGSTTRDFALPEVTTLSGTATNEGSPVASVQINVETWHEPTWQPLHCQSQVQTDANGQYQVYVFDQANYRLELHPQQGSGIPSRTIYGIAVDGATVYDIALEAGIFIEGTVTLSDGVTPVEYVRVWGHNELTGDYMGDAQTDENGYYKLTIEPGTYDISYEVNRNDDQTPIPQQYFHNLYVNDLETTQSVVLNIELPDFAILTGKVLGDGSPLSNLQVEAEMHNLGPWGGHLQDYYQTDQSGNYRLVLMPGEATIRVHPGVETGFPRFVEENFVVSGDAVHDLNLAPGFRLEGRVLLADGQTTLRDTNLYAAANDSGDYSGDGYTDSSGEYLMILPAGIYDLTVNSHAWDESLPIPGHFDLYQYVQDLEIASDIVFDVILPEFQSITGKVTDLNGVGVPDVYFHCDFHGYNYSSDQDSSDAFGNYELYLVGNPANNGQMHITPPQESGFISTQINDLRVSDSIRQNVILNLVDTKPPRIVSGPIVTNVTDESFTVEWQTNELATSVLTYGIADPPSTEESDLTLKTTHSIQVDGLQPETWYYYKVGSTDTNGNGPTESTVQTVRTAALPDTTAPIFTENPLAASITDTTALIQWATDESVFGHVDYGTSTTLGQSVMTTTGPPFYYPMIMNAHSVRLSNLAPNTRYYFQVRAFDASGNGPTTSPMASFVTLPVPDTTAPVIVAGPLVTDISHDSATISWQTNEPADGGVSYNDGTAFGAISDASFVQNHSLRITDLASNTEYSYTVSSSDAQGNGPTVSETLTFFTLDAPDTSSPLILEGPAVIDTNSDSARIRWVTNEPSDSLVEYGETDSLGSQVGRAVLETEHLVDIAALQPDTGYHFRVRSVDSAGNPPTTSAIATFTTDALPDTQPPVILEGPAVVYVSDTKCTIEWTTDELSDSVVDYGADGNLNLRRSNPEQVLDHQITLTGLQPGESYSFEVSSTDSSGNTVYSSDIQTARRVVFAFQTAVEPDTDPPVIRTGPAVVDLTESKAIIEWRTDEIADSRVNYGVMGQGLNRQAGDIVPRFGHRIVLTNLQPQTTYEAIVSSVDINRNGPTQSSVFQFTTESLPDTEAPVFTFLPRVSNKQFNRATVTWSTNEPASSMVRFGTSAAALSKSASRTGLESDHSVTLTNLTQYATYYFQVVSRDASGNEAVSGTGTFTIDVAADAGSAWNLYR